MSKSATQKATPLDQPRFCKSTFTLTIAVEILGIEVWHDCNEGWVDLGPCVQGLKVQYQLYPGQNFDVDILIWPHVAKIWCGSNFGWVRTWLFLERRFLTFSIRHVFPVRVVDLRSFTATITPTMGYTSLGSNAKNDKNAEAFIPPLQFGEQRYFAPVFEKDVTLAEYLWDTIWKLIVEFIPTSNLDGLFDVPTPVTDVRHRDAILYYVKEAILNNLQRKTALMDLEQIKTKDKSSTKLSKDKEKEKKKFPDAPKVKFEIKLSGDSILAGVGRVIRFDTVGQPPSEIGEIIAIISSTNLPAQDDYPIIFINVDTLFDVPTEYFKKLRVTQLYTRWILGKEIRDSIRYDVQGHQTDIQINDHHAFPLEPHIESEITSLFLENPFEIQLRGLRITSGEKQNPQFFGYKKDDQCFGLSSYRLNNVDSDFLIAVTKIDAKNLSKGMNKLIWGEYPLYPPKITVKELEREKRCTNDINHIKTPTTLNLIVPGFVVLQAQMTLGVSMGYVGCQPKKLKDSYARIYSLIQDSEAIMTVIKFISEINDAKLKSHSKEEVLSGFALDVGDIVLLYVEGPSDGEILKVWDMTEIFYPKIKPIYSSSNRYSTRIYSELLMGLSFNVLKMFAPLAVILACPPVYARPALPLPARSALLKVGRIISGKLRVTPCRGEMPSAEELKSFKLELCVDPKPSLLTEIEQTNAADNGRGHQNISLQKINWRKQDAKKVGNEEK